MENLNKRPSKGILRFSEGSSRSNSVEKDIKWDENNIKETLHPDDKDYGYMKIDEPPTPYSRSPHGQDGENSDDEECNKNTTDLLEKVSKRIKEPPVTLENVEGLLDESDLNAIIDGNAEDGDRARANNDDDDDMENGSDRMNTSSASTPSVASTSRSPRLSTDGSVVTEFELKRKKHYNEFYAVKLAKKLMEKELKDDHDDEGDDGGNGGKEKEATSDSRMEGV